MVNVKNVTQCGGVGCENVPIGSYNIPLDSGVRENAIIIEYDEGVAPTPYDF